MISFIVPTIGRTSLHRTIDSIECWPGDEILIVGNAVKTLEMLKDDPKRGFMRFFPQPPGGDWGHTERNFVTPFARGRYIAHIDDDDHYADGTRALMASGIEEAKGRPILFRMRFPNGITLWEDKAIYCGNVGTPMFLMPNEPEKFGTWGSFVGGDCQFLETSKWTANEYLWRPEVIAILGHNPGEVTNE